MVSGDAADLVKARDQLLDAGPDPSKPRMDAPTLRQALADLYEMWLTAKAAELAITTDSGLSILAVGGLGRHEMLPYSDLDLVLLYDSVEPERIAEIADQLWYPLWDAHIKLDHSVRTVPQALQVAAADLTAALGMLQARHIVGDVELSNVLIGGVRQQWRSSIRWRFDELVGQTTARWQRSGEIAHRVEPDLKNGRGGLRDVQILDALALAQLTDAAPVPGPHAPGGGLAQAHRRLLDVRTELHRIAGRSRDTLQAQDADDIGAALGIGDRFDLARILSDSARTVGYSVEVGFRTAANALPRRGLALLRRLPVRRPLAEGVVEQDGEVMLARHAIPRRDPGLVLRVAAAAARAELPIAATTLNRLAESAPELREPWPRESLNDLLVLLGSGRAMVATVEAMDRTGLWGRLVPEWGAVRDLPPRDQVHTWTVDRHIVETVAQTGALATRVRRPDLLVLGALLHDIGKGGNGDHSVLGAQLATRIGSRLGLPESDVEVVRAMVRNHLLLPETATRRDLDDPATVATVAGALDGDVTVLHLLHALAEADSLATGPGVWGEWKAALIGKLVRRCELVMAGEPLPEPLPLAESRLRPTDDNDVYVDISPGGSRHTYTVAVTAPDTSGMLSHMAGVLALHSLRVWSATSDSYGGSAINSFVVSPKFGDPPEAGLLRQELIRAAAGELDLLAGLAARERDAVESRPTAVRKAGVPAGYAQSPPRIIWLDLPAGQDMRGGSVILEVRAEDRVGLLCRLAAALASCGADVRWAKVATLGVTVVDAFSLDIRDDSPARRTEIENAVRAVVAGAAPTPG